MKKLTVLIAGLGLSLALNSGSLESSMAEEKGLILQADTLFGGSTQVKQPAKNDVSTDSIRLGADPSKSEAVAGEFISGLVGAALLGAAGGSIGYSMTNKRENQVHYLGEGWDFSDDNRGLTGAVVGYVIASNIGCPLAVYLIGNSGDYKGSYLEAMIGSLVGTAVGGAISYPIIKNAKWPKTGAYIAGIGITATAQTIGAVVGFSHSRKKRAEASLGALLNLKDGKLSLGFPKVSVARNSKVLSGFKINLFRAKF